MTCTLNVVCLFFSYFVCFLVFIVSLALSFTSFDLKVCSIEQEIVSGLVNRVSHPNLTHYLAVNVQETVPFVKVQVISNCTMTIQGSVTRWLGRGT